MGTAVERASAVSEIRQKASGYGMPSERVDGMDLLKVYEAAQKALEHVRTEGPFLLEAITYRYRGHSMGDPERYRASDEIEKWRKDDPIGIYRAKLLTEMGFSESILDEEEERVEEVLQEAIQFAEASPEPAPETLFDYLYVD